MASYIIVDLSLDWRIGAELFEPLGLTSRVLGHELPSVLGASWVSLGMRCPGREDFRVLEVCRVFYSAARMRLGFPLADTTQVCGVQVQT